MVFLLAIPLGGFIAWNMDTNKRNKMAQDSLRAAGPKSAFEKYYIREIAGGSSENPPLMLTFCIEHKRCLSGIVCAIVCELTPAKHIF